MIYDLKQVHVEASGRCNSRCPMCSRHTGMGFIQPELDQYDLPLEIFYKFFTKERTENLKHVYFSGVYGDPCLNKNLPEFIQWLKTNRVDVAVDTNGGYRSPDWWATMGKANTRIHFAVDGLEDTNHIYRRNVLWKKVWENMNAFQEAGGNGQWAFIVFKHNEHQVDEAKAMAESIGMDFRIKVTQKFRGHKNFSVMEDGKKLYDLFPPENPKYRHANVGDKEHIPKKDYFYFNKKGTYGTLGLTDRSDFDNTEIDCVIKQRKELFLAYTGHVFPCCYIGTPFQDGAGAGQFKELIDRDLLNLNKVSVEEAIDNLKVVEESWYKESIGKGKLLTCARTCGKTSNNRTTYVK